MMTTATTPNVPAVKAPGWPARIKTAITDETVRDDLWRINNLLLPLLLVALLAAVGVGWRAHAVGPVLLWVFASLAAGGTAGFLFGIPKSGTSVKVDAPAAAAGGAGVATVATVAATVVPAAADGGPRARPNTNLEEVSDWLTKILVGLTLVNLKDLRDEIAGISLNAAAALNATPTRADVSTATALIVGFALIGFLSVYLYMRLFIQGAISRSDDELTRVAQYQSVVRQAEQQISQRAPEPAALANADAAEPVVPSTASMTAAREVAAAAPPNRPELVLLPLRKLASEYEALRQAADYSASRTHQMADIVQRMRPHALAAAPYIDELINSPSPGDHLAATVILQMKYLPEHMAWLARRLVEERAFIGYQAASALLARMRVAGAPECKAIQAAVGSAQAERARMGVTDASLDKLIARILENE